MIQLKADYRWPAGIVYGQDDAVYMYHAKFSVGQREDFVPSFPVMWPHRIPLNGKYAGRLQTAKQVRVWTGQGSRVFGNELYIMGSYDSYELLACPLRGCRVLGSVPYYAPDQSDHVVFRRSRTGAAGQEIRWVPAGTTVAGFGPKGGFVGYAKNYLESYRDLQFITVTTPQTQYPKPWLLDVGSQLPNVFRRCRLWERDVLVGLTSHSFDVVALGPDAPWGVLPGLDPSSVVSDFDFSPCGTRLAVCVMEDHQTLVYLYSVNQEGDRWTFTQEATYRLPALFVAWSPDGLSIALLGAEDEHRVRPFNLGGCYAQCDTLTLIDSQ